MPELAEAPAVTTALQAQIAKTTNAAVVDTAFDSDFDAEVEAAIARDSGEKPKAGKPESGTVSGKAGEPVREKAVESVLAKALDIPDALLTKKEKATATAAAEVDADREKAIKEQTAGMSPKAADRFRAIEAKAHAAEQKAARAEKLEKELADVQERLKGAIDTTAADALKKQVEEYSELLDKNAITEHPRFKAKFDIPLAKEIATATKLVSKEAGPEVEALLSLPETAQRNRRLNEIAGELEEVERGKFIKAIDNADRLSTERAGEVANWKVNKTRLAELSEQEKSQAVEHRERSIEKALKSVLPRFTDDEKGIELFRKDDGNVEWNKTVEARLENVRKLTAADLSKEDTAEMAAWALAGSDYRKLFLTQRVLVQRLQEEIAALKEGGPDLGSGGAGTGDDDEQGSMIDIVTRIAQKAGAVR